jgi:glycosyltransferase involved in cell wall biosynthesis
MFTLFTPKWINQHLYTGKCFIDLSQDEVLNLRKQLNKFRVGEPEVSIVIPAWNEANNIYRTLSSLAASTTDLATELIVINNNSTDNTQQVLDELGVKSLFQPIQGTPHARQMGLENARGKYHLCADSDTFYPPSWVDLMVKPMNEKDEIVGVYGRYSFLPLNGNGRLLLSIYEHLTGLLVRIRRSNREHINVLGFNMGFKTKVGLTNGGFNVTEVRKFDNAIGSNYFVDEAEDGKMALNLKKTGKLQLVTDSKARVFTSSRRLNAEGGILKSFFNRVKLHSKRMKEYIVGPNIKEL